MNSLVKRKLDSSQWQADAVVHCIAEALPLGSFEACRRLIDAVRFLSNFYLALYLTTFLSIAWHLGLSGGGGDYAMGIGPAGLWTGLLSAAPVLASNLFGEPYLSLQFSIISTMSCLNPLLLGETLEFVEETAKMMDHVAFRLLKKYIDLADFELDRSDADDVESVRVLLKHVFEDWDAAGLGFLDKRAFVHAISSSLKLHFTTQQMNCIFRAIDPDMNGEIVFDEFWGLLEKPVGKVRFSPARAASPLL